MNISKLNFLTEIGERVYEFKNQSFYSSRVHSYLIDEDDAVYLVDGPTMSERQASQLFKTNKPVYMLLTHGSCSRESGELFKHGLQKIFLYREDFDYPWNTLSREAQAPIPKRRYSFSKNLEAIFTPGHTAGSACFLFESDRRYLFSGDTLAGQGNQLGPLIGSYDDDPEQMLKSLKKLFEKESFDAILPFHYDMLLNDSEESLKRAFFEALREHGH